MPLEMDSANETIVPGTDDPGACSTPLATVDDGYCCDVEEENVEPLGRMCVGADQSDVSESNIAFCRG